MMKHAALRIREKFSTVLLPSWMESELNYRHFFMYVTYFQILTPFDSFDFFCGSSTISCLAGMD